MVKDIMIEEQTQKYTIRSKTGWSYDGFDNGWYIGYVENENGVWFFATRIRKDLDEVNRKFSKCRVEITKKVLANKDVL